MKHVLIIKAVTETKVHCLHVRQNTKVLSVKDKDSIRFIEKGDRRIHYKVHFFLVNRYVAFNYHILSNGVSPLLF